MNSPSRDVISEDTTKMKIPSCRKLKVIVISLLYPDFTDKTHEGTLSGNVDAAPYYN